MVCWLRYCACPVGVVKWRVWLWLAWVNRLDCWGIDSIAEGPTRLLKDWLEEGRISKYWMERGTQSSWWFCIMSVFLTESIVLTIESNVAQIESILSTAESVLITIESVYHNRVNFCHNRVNSEHSRVDSGAAHNTIIGSTILRLAIKYNCTHNTWFQHSWCDCAVLLTFHYLSNHQSNHMTYKSHDLRVT